MNFVSGFRGGEPWRSTPSPSVLSSLVPNPSPPLCRPVCATAPLAAGGIDDSDARRRPHVWKRQVVTRHSLHSAKQSRLRPWRPPARHRTRSPSTMPLKLFLGDAAPLLADRISAGLAEMRDCEAGCPCSGACRGETTTPALLYLASRYRRTRTLQIVAGSWYFPPPSQQWWRARDLRRAMSLRCSRGSRKLGQSPTCSRCHSSTPLFNEAGGFPGTSTLPISALSNPIPRKEVKILTPAQFNALDMC